MRCRSRSTLQVLVRFSSRLMCSGRVVQILGEISKSSSGQSNPGATAVGACIIYASEAFDPTAVPETVAAKKCTVLGGVPTMFIAELEHPDFAKFDLGSLRTGLIGAVPYPVEVMKRAFSEMHMKDMIIAYGTTKPGPMSFQTLLDDPIERRVSIVGRTSPYRIQVRR